MTTRHPDRILIGRETWNIRNRIDDRSAVPRQHGGRDQDGRGRVDDWTGCIEAFSIDAEDALVLDRLLVTLKGPAPEAVLRRRGV